MLSILLILIVAVGVALIAVILIQQTQTGGLSAFTGGASGSVFGAKGSTGFLFKLTAGLMIVFAVLCVLVANVAGKGEKASLLDVLSTEQTEIVKPVDNETLPDDEIPALESSSTQDSNTLPSLEAAEEKSKKEE